MSMGMRELRRGLAAVSLSVLAPVPGFAALAFNWEFTPSYQQLLPTDTYEIIGTLTNTGSTKIVGITYLESWYGSIGPYISAWNWNPDFWTDYYSGLDIDPGESFTFWIANVDIVNAPAGSYTGVADAAPYQTRIGVVDDVGAYSGEVAVSGRLDLQIPEPSVIGLAALALLGAGLARRGAAARRG